MSQDDCKDSMYALRSASKAKRYALAGIAATWVAIIWWMLFAGGLDGFRAFLGLTYSPGNLLRKSFMAAALSAYYMRLLFTWFVFLKRGMRWQEVSAVATWLLCIYVVMAIAAGTNGAPYSASGISGLILFCGGSWLNSYAEYVRHIWKENPAHHGMLYTEGPFRYACHPNYLGDLLAYSGLCLIAGRWMTVFVPLVTAAGFVFVSVPALDAYLLGRYGKTFEDYSKRTSKLIPFVY